MILREPFDRDQSADAAPSRPRSRLHLCASPSRSPSPLVTPTLPVESVGLTPYRVQDDILGHAEIRKQLKPHNIGVGASLLPRALSLTASAACAPLSCAQELRLSPLCSYGRARPQPHALQAAPRRRGDRRLPDRLVPARRHQRDPRRPPHVGQEGRHRVPACRRRRPHQLCRPLCVALSSLSRRPSQLATSAIECSRCRFSLTVSIIDYLCVSGTKERNVLECVGLSLSLLISTRSSS